MGTQLTKSQYEGTVLRTLRHHLMKPGWEISYDGKIRVEAIELDTSGQASMLEILFRDDARPECLFGWRYPATEADSDALESVEHPEPWEKGLRGTEQAEIWALTFVLTHFEEQIEAAGYGLPAECDSEGVTWVGSY
jgi:hypothetical protein